MNEVKLNKEIIRGFVGGLLAQGFDDASESPEFHDECWDLCTSKHKYVAIAAPRGHAKSSGVTLGYGLATLLFRERKYMLLVSDTESQASLFLGNFKTALKNNKELAELFELKRNAQGEVYFEKDSETDIIVSFNDGHQFRIMVKGSEQKMRGLLWDGRRPDIVLCDDIENDELVMNKERREKMRRWFKAALLPCISDRGVVRMVGTVLHMDSLLEGYMPKVKHPLTRYDDLKIWQTGPVNGWIAVKYRAYNQDFSKLLWPQKKTRKMFEDLRNEAIADGTLDLHSQEYLNHPLDESTAYFKRGDFLPMEKGDILLHNQRRLNYYITADLAISLEQKADYSVFCIAGMDENRMLHIVDVIRERMDGAEIVDTILNLQRIYKPDMFGLEDMQVSKSILPFLQEEMVKTNTYINLFKLKTLGKDKPTRAKSLQARMRARGVRFNKEAPWYNTFEEELIRFPRDKHDDQVDAASYIGIMLNSLVEASTLKEIEDEDFQEQLEESGYLYGGRSHVTGY
jgi:predicted phage terminase large subunit-like protein